MHDWQTLGVIAMLGVVCYAMRAGGFLAAGLMREDGTIAKFLKLAPANLFVAFVAAVCLEGGWPYVLGCAGAFIVMALTGKKWAALGARFATTILSGAFLSH